MATRWKRATPGAGPVGGGVGVGVGLGVGVGVGVGDGDGVGVGLGVGVGVGSGLFRGLLLVVAWITVHRYRREVPLRCARTASWCDPTARRRSVSRRAHLREAPPSTRHVVWPRAIHLK